MADEQVDLETRAEAAASPAREVRRWLLEIRLASKREKEWREKAKAILDKYRGKDKKKNSFNILWANTETLRPALYNSIPKPDVRRRFRQEDMLGKAVSELMERATTYCVDAYDLDLCLKNDVLDALLGGRGLSRVRYIPQFKDAKPTDSADGDASEAGETNEAKPSVDGNEGTSRIKAGFFPTKKKAVQAQPENGPETNEELEYEQALCDHVQWEDYLQGPGKTNGEIPWKAFRHRLTRDDLMEKFGEDIGKEIKLNEVSEPELQENQDRELKEVFQRAEVWEIWDKDSERVFFINESYRKGLIYPEGEDGTPPLKLKDFFPCPRPLQLVEDTGSLIPIPLYELYREQADELDRVSARITKIVNACRVRFVHDPTLTELKALMDADDNIGIPAESARAWMANGGIEKAIWWMPIQNIAAVLKELYVSRDATKQVIYEITGISDIIRGATDPRETLGAQKLKANSSSLRLQRMQREVQRYVRDLIRLLSEVIGEHFSQQTLAQMTGLQFPTAQQKQVVQLKMQAIQQAVQGGQQPPPEVAQQLQQAQELLAMPSWEDIMAVLQSDMAREYRVDVETDSTVAETLQQDMEGLKEVVGGLVEFWNGAGPAVQSGALSIEAVKSISMLICRRARFGLEVEDALEKGFQQPKPQDNGEAAKAAVEKQKLDSEQQRDQAKMAMEDRHAQQEHEREQMRIQSEQASKERQAQIQAEVDNHRAFLETQRDQLNKQAEIDFERWKAELDARTKIEIAEIGAKASLQADQAKAASEAAKGEQVKEEKKADREAQVQVAKSTPAPKVEIHNHLPGGKKTITTPRGEKYTSEETT